MKLPTSIYFLPRRIHIFITAAIVYVILKSTQLFNKLFRRTSEQIDVAWSRANYRSANIILRTSTARLGLWIKCCQYIAARSDALPEEYTSVLSKSLDDCPPTPPSRVLNTVSEELLRSDAGAQIAKGTSASLIVNDLFTDFDAAAPIASASIAQVHTATERSTGRRVVLKVQHPNVRPMLLQDLADLMTLLTWVAGAEPEFDLRPVLHAWIEMVPLETDFINERQNMVHVRNALANVPTHLASNAYVPDVLPHYSTDKLLVMEFIDGLKIPDIVKNPPDSPINSHALVEQITRSFGCQLFFCNVFSGDPHPGNFLVHRLDTGGQPVLLDFGICVKVSGKLRVGFAKLLLAAVFDDSYSLVQALADIGVMVDRADPVASLDAVKFLFRTTAPRDESRKELSDMRDNMIARTEVMRKNERENPVVQNAHDTLPSDGKKTRPRNPLNSFSGDLTFFFRSLGMLRGLAVSLNVRHSYLETIRPYAEHVLYNAYPSSERMSAVIARPIVATSYHAIRSSKLLQKLLPKLYDRDMLIGMQVAVYHCDELVLSLAAGRMGKSNPRPVCENTLFNSFSTTKGLTAILFASLQDEYNVQYDDLVTKYWPEFAQGGKENTTVGHILSHTAGLAKTLPEDMAMPKLRDDWHGVIRHFETATVSQPPGEKMDYHVLSFGWLVAGLIDKITGSPYQTHLKSFVQKMGIEGECYCGTMPDDLLSDQADERIATLSSAIVQDVKAGAFSQALQQAASKDKHGRGETSVGSTTGGLSGLQASFEGGAEGPAKLNDHGENALQALVTPVLGVKVPVYLLDPNFFNHPVLRAGFLPSANGHFSARALARLYGALGNDGVVGGTRALQAGRAGEMQKAMVDFSYLGDRSWGAGLTIFNTVDKTDHTHSARAIGHGGLGGSFAFAIPGDRISMAVTVNQLNAFSIAAGLVIALCCRGFDVGVLETFAPFAKLFDNFFEKDGEIADKDVDDLIDRAVEGFAGKDFMTALVG